MGRIGVGFGQAYDILDGQEEIPRCGIPAHTKCVLQIPLSAMDNPAREDGPVGWPDIDIIHFHVAAEITETVRPFLFEKGGRIVRENAVPSFMHLRVNLIAIKVRHAVLGRGRNIVRDRTIVALFVLTEKGATVQFVVSLEKQIGI
jgi:hypothetical protein